jgi:hypothetical protein
VTLAPFGESKARWRAKLEKNLSALKPSNRFIVSRTWSGANLRQGVRANYDIEATKSGHMAALMAGT